MSVRVAVLIKEALPLLKVRAEPKAINTWIEQTCVTMPCSSLLKIIFGELVRKQKYG